MKDFCKANNMSFVSIESYEEDLALYSAFGGSEGKNCDLKIIKKRFSDEFIYTN